MGKIPTYQLIQTTVLKNSYCITDIRRTKKIAVAINDSFAQNYRELESIRIIQDTYYFYKTPLYPLRKRYAVYLYI